jgi:adenylate cyclase
MPWKRPSSGALLTGAFVVIGVIWGAFLGARQLGAVGSALDRLEYVTVDWRFLLAGEQPAPRGVTIVAIDDETVREGGGYPLSRSVLARIVRGLAAHQPQAIAIDMLFLDPGDAQKDMELADALRSTKTVVAAIGLFDRSRSASSPDAGLSSGEMDLAPRPSSILWPMAAVRDATRVGLVNLSTDHSGVPRYVPMIFGGSDAIMPSFALAVPSAALNTEPVVAGSTLKLAARTLRLDFGFHMPIRYYGPRGSFRQFSAARVLRGDVDANQVRGQVVLLGTTAIALGDTFATPFDRMVPGVEIFATAISNVLAGEGLVRTSAIRRADAAAAMLLPVVAVLLIALRRIWLGLALVGLVLALWIAATCAAFLVGYWLSVAVPLAAVLPVAAGYGAARLTLDRHATRRLEREKAALARFQSPRLLDHILNDPDFLQKPAQQDAAIVFLDLSRFTEVAETLGPQWSRDLLADFQTLVERDMAAQGGYVSAFMGDGAMIIFGLPQPKPDDASRALLAIAQLDKSIAEWLRTLPPVARDRLSVRIGGHVGPLVMSRLGPVHHQHVTATGDTVNVTSRLLEVAKQQGARVVISEDLYVAAKSPGSVGDTLMTVSPIEVRIRGRAEPLRIRAWR